VPTPRGSRRRDATGFNWDAKRGAAQCNVYIKGGGGRVRKRVTIRARSRDEALEKWVAYRKKWRAAPAGAGPVPTLRQFLDSYFDEITAGLKPSTIRGYHYTLHGRILPEWGHVKLNEFTSGRLNLWVKRLQGEQIKRKKKRRLSPSTINGTINVLKTILSKAVKWDIIEESPLRKPIDHVKVTPPTQELNLKERAAFLAAFDDEPGFHAWLERYMPRGNVREIRGAKEDAFGGKRKIGAGIRPGSPAAKEYFARYRFLKPFFVCLLELGLRRGDALQLRWSEVDLDAGLIQLVTRKRNVAVVLPISKACREALLECRRRPVLSEFVFATEVGKLLPEVRLRRAFRTAKELAGIDRPFRIHDCRHTYASLLVSAGANLSAVATLLAHADVRTTNRYARAEKFAAAEVARSILDAMEKG
jgi:integrase